MKATITIARSIDRIRQNGHERNREAAIDIARRINEAIGGKTITATGLTGKSRSQDAQD